MNSERDEPPEAVPVFAPGQRLTLDPERVLWRDVGDELVIFEVPTATYLTLNSSARALWKHLEEGASPVELASQLVTSYAIPEDKAARDVQKFLEALEARSLLSPAG
jgi:Coenzyme PQQ synthesis protein D (PqqD)